MGGAVALMLARKGVSVTLFDQADAPFSGASRWNEGKIHLGYLYAGDPSLETARSVLPGGLAFKALTEELIGCSLDAATTQDDDTYLIHRDSVASLGATAGYFSAVSALAREHADASRYLVDLSDRNARTLSPAELERDYDTAKIQGGFRVPERSVSTQWLADRFVDALGAQPRIALAMATRVTAVREDGARFHVETANGPDGPFDFVVNALWEGRLAIDASVDIAPPPTWSHRFRLSLFARTAQALTLPSTVLATGPFGDIKNYNGRDFYLSWYPSGLIAEGAEIAPPPAPALSPADRARVIRDVLAELGAYVRAVPQIGAGADIRLEGGWVYAAGKGSLADPRSTLHRRDQAGIQRRGGYFTVDTGKYSIAPWLAQKITDAILGQG
ncbi:MAG: FAD-dependent oxidoreductase [Terricaulis sp.]